METAPRRRWPARVAGALATAALLGTGVAIAVMVMPSGDDEVAIPVAPASTPAPEAEEEKPEPRFTRAQRRARQAAVDELTVEGYEPVKLSDYDPESELRVLLGEADDGSLRAWFFAGRQFLGYDSEFASGRLRVVRAGDRAVTLGYGLAAGGAERVRFRWDGATLSADAEIPPPELRAPIG